MAESSIGPVRAETVDKLSQSSSATVAYYLFKKGIRNSFMAGVAPLTRGRLMVGYAATLRYLPMREDLADPSIVGNPSYPQRQLVENIEAGAVLAIDARGNLMAGVLGDILIARLQARGAAGVVTDGAMRDTPSLAEGQFPVYAGGVHGAAHLSQHLAMDANLPIQCGGVLVMPGDLLFGDGEGVVVIPRRMMDQVVEDCWQQERQERFILGKVQSGSSIVGVYPPNEETLREYREWLAGDEVETAGTEKPGQP